LASGALIWFVGEKSESRQLDRGIQVRMFDNFGWDCWFCSCFDDDSNITDDCRPGDWVDGSELVYGGIGSFHLWYSPMDSTFFANSRCWIGFGIIGIERIVFIGHGLLTWTGWCWVTDCWATIIDEWFGWCPSDCDIVHLGLADGISAGGSLDSYQRSFLLVKNKKKNQKLNDVIVAAF
jgi:hypothetical protein